MRVTDGENQYECFIVTHLNMYEDFQQWLNERPFPEGSPIPHSAGVVKACIGDGEGWKAKQLYPLYVIDKNDKKLHIYQGGLPSEFKII